MTRPEYGGIAREDRITAERYCDKAWHLDDDKPVKATIVLTCAHCGRVYARCAQCDRGGDACAVSMRARGLVVERYTPVVTAMLDRAIAQQSALMRSLNTAYEAEQAQAKGARHDP